MDTTDGGSNGGLKILCVDRDLDQLDMLRYLLGELGHTASSATTGADAMLLAQQVRPDLAIIGMKLFDCTGAQLAQRLSGNTNTARIVRVALTGSGLGPDDECFKDFARVLYKPLAIADLIAFLNAQSLILASIRKFPFGS